MMIWCFSMSDIRKAVVAFDEAVDSLVVAYGVLKATGVVPKSVSKIVDGVLNVLPAISETLKQTIK